MNRFLTRIVAILLIPCLVVSAPWAYPAASRFHPKNELIPGAISSQALAGVLVTSHRLFLTLKDNAIGRLFRLLLKPRSIPAREFATTVLVPLEWATLDEWQNDFLGYKSLGLRAVDASEEPEIADRIKGELLSRHSSHIQTCTLRLPSGEELPYRILVDPSFPNVDHESIEFRRHLETVLVQLPETDVREMLAEWNTTPFVRARVSSARFALTDHLANGFEGIRQEVHDDDGTLLTQWLHNLERKWLLSLNTGERTRISHLPEKLRRRIDIFPTDRLRDIFLTIADEHEVRHEALVAERRILQNWTTWRQIAVDGARSAVLTALSALPLEGGVANLILREIEGEQRHTDIGRFQSILDQTPAEADELAWAESEVRAFINPDVVPVPFSETQPLCAIVLILRDVYLGALDPQLAFARLWRLEAFSEHQVYRLPEEWMRSAVALVQLPGEDPEGSFGQVINEQRESLSSALRRFPDAVPVSTEPIDGQIERQRQAAHGRFAEARHSAGLEVMGTASAPVAEMTEALIAALQPYGFRAEFLRMVILGTRTFWEQILAPLEEEPDPWGTQPPSEQLERAVQELRVKPTPPDPSQLASQLTGNAEHDMRLLLSITPPPRIDQLLAHYPYLLPRVIPLVSDPHPDVRGAALEAIVFLIGDQAVSFLEKTQVNPAGIQALFWGYMEMGWRLLWEPPNGYETHRLYDRVWGWAEVCHHALDRLGVREFDDLTRRLARQTRNGLQNQIFPIGGVEYQLEPRWFFVALRHGQAEILSNYLTGQTVYDIQFKDRSSAVGALLDNLSRRFSSESNATQNSIILFLDLLHRNTEQRENLFPPSVRERLATMIQTFKLQAINQAHLAAAAPLAVGGKFADTNTYSEIDFEAAKRLMTALKQEGLTVGRAFGDIGGGKGFIAHMIQAFTGADVTIFEKERELVALGMRLTRELSERGIIDFTKVHWVQGDIESSRRPPLNTFDVLYCNPSIIWGDPVFTPFSFIYEVRPGALLLFPVGVRDLNAQQQPMDLPGVTTKKYGPFIGYTRRFA